MGQRRTRIGVVYPPVEASAKKPEASLAFRPQGVSLESQPQQKNGG